MAQALDLEKELTANQLYKTYKAEGGTKTFSEWLNREKTKGVFPINAQANEEVQKNIRVIKDKDMNKTILGFPVRTLAIVGVVIVGAVVLSSYLKKNQ